MGFNASIWHVMRFRESKIRPLYQFKLGDLVLNSADKEGIVIIVISNLNPVDHMRKTNHRVLAMNAKMKWVLGTWKKSSKSSYKTGANAVRHELR